MKSNDFCFMRRGQVIKACDGSEALSINRRSLQKQRALLLLHGFASTPAVFREMLPQLATYDAVVCPLLAGHGECLLDFSTSTGQAWLDCALEACEALMGEYAAVDVMGLSLGGLLACHLSQRFKLNHLYLLAPALILRKNSTRLLYLAKGLHGLGFTYLRNTGGNICDAYQHELTFRLLPIKTIIEMIQLIRAYPQTPLMTPTDLYLGRHDEVVDSERIAAMALEWPNANIHWLEHSAHILPLDRDRGQIIV